MATIFSPTRTYSVEIIFKAITHSDTFYKINNFLLYGNLYKINETIACLTWTRSGLFIHRRLTLINHDFSKKISSKQICF